MNELVTGTITITRKIAENGGDLNEVWTADASGEPLQLVEALGMLRLAEDSIIRGADE